MAVEINNILKGCVENDRASQKELYLRYKDFVFRVCRSYARDNQEAEDYVQNSFLNVFRYFKGNKNLEINNIEAWLHKVAVNTSLKSKKSKVVKNTYYYDRDSFPKEEQVSMDLSHLDRNEYLFGLLKKLPDGYRKVFVAYVIDELSHKEIAMKIGISESTSRSQLLKARKWLQVKLEDLRKTEYEL